MASSANSLTVSSDAEFLALVNSFWDSSDPRVIDFDVRDISLSAALGFVINDTSSPITRDGQTIPAYSFFVNGLSFAFDNVTWFAESAPTYILYFRGTDGDDAFFNPAYSPDNKEIRIEWSAGDDYYEVESGNFSGRGYYFADVKFENYALYSGEGISVALDDDPDADFVYESSFGVLTLSAQPGQIDGTTFSDSINGNSANNIINLGHGNDLSLARGGHDVVTCGDGSEFINLGVGADVAIKWGTGHLTIDVVSDGTWGSSYSAVNVDSPNGGIGTYGRVSLLGLNKVEDFLIVNSDASVEINLVDEVTGFALFLEDPYSDYHFEVDDIFDHYVGGTKANGQRADASNSDVTIEGSEFRDVIDLTSSLVGTGNGSFIIRGNGGNDVIWGGDTNDVLDGGSGNDVLFGGKGSDVLTGGLGEDIFEFTATSGSNVVSDFDHEDDQIYLYYRRGEAEESDTVDVVNGLLTWGNVQVSLSDTELQFSDVNIVFEVV